MDVHPGTSIGSKQGLHPLAQLSVVPTRLIQQVNALLRVAVDGAVK
jgi:hypothetical protein